MAVKKGAINAFESQLASALKSAAITAAANLFTNNPEMTLEDFYSVMRPQGVTESITLMELHAALSGGVVSVPTVSLPAPSSEKVKVSFRQAEAPKRRQPKTPPVVSCQTHEGQQAYHQSILEYLSTENWVRSPDIMAFCGGTAGQLGVAMRKYLIPGELVKSKGKTIGLHFAATAKGKQKAQSGTAVTITTAPKSKRRRASRGSPDIGEDGRTLEARDAYRAAILKFMHGSRWLSGPEISAACGGAPARRKRAVRNLIAEGLVEHNGKMTGSSRWRRRRG